MFSLSAPRRSCAPSFVLMPLLATSFLVNLLLPANAQTPNTTPGTYVWTTTDANGNVIAQSPTFSGGQWTSGYENATYPYESGTGSSGGGTGTGDSSGQTDSEGDLTATFTWSDPNNPSDPAPPCIIMQTSTAEWEADGFNFQPMASCSDGLGDPEVDSGSGENFLGRSSGTLYSVVSPSSGTITVKLKGAQANLDPGSNQYGDYGSTVEWSVSAYPVTVNLSGGIGLSTSKRLLVGQQLGATLSTGPLTQTSWDWSVSGGSPFKNWTADASNATYTPLRSKN